MFLEDAVTIEVILGQLNKCPLVSSLKEVEAQKSPVRGRQGVTAFEGQIQVEGCIVTIHIGLDDRFPLSLPLIYLIPWNILGMIPHVEVDGYVCYAQQEGLLVNRRDPLGIIEAALQKARSVLGDGVTGKNRNDFIDEFEAYWRRLDGIEAVESLVHLDEKVREIIGVKYSNHPNESYFCLSDHQTVVAQYYNNAKLKPYTIRNGLYIPLKPGTFVMPPFPDRFWSVEEIRQMVWSNLTPNNQGLLKQLIRKSKWEEVVVIDLLRPSGGSVLFGIQYMGIESDHPLQPGGKARTVRPLWLTRRDKDFLLPRGGANKILQTKRVALIGCGSVGGFVAFELVRAGILNLSLIDHDNLEPENTFRHVLGRSTKDQPEPKVQALKQEIQRKFPYVQVEPIQARAEIALMEGTFKPEGFDLIVVAIGDDTVSLHLNEVLSATTGTPPIIFTWLEPYGIGGHVLLTNNASCMGCLECLYTPVIGDEELIYNRAAFAASGQTFAKDLSGCANLFTPYGSSDAVQTALLATRLAVDTLLGAVSGNPLLSWKGDATPFLKAGFRLSSRYSLTPEKLNEQCFGYYNPDCPICRSKS